MDCSLSFPIICFFSVGFVQWNSVFYRYVSLLDLYLEENNLLAIPLWERQNKKVYQEFHTNASNLKKHRHFVAFELWNNNISKALSPKAYMKKGDLPNGNKNNKYCCATDWTRSKCWRGSSSLFSLLKEEKIEGQQPWSYWEEDWSERQGWLFSLQKGLKAKLQNQFTVVTVTIKLTWWKDGGGGGWIRESTPTKYLCVQVASVGAAKGRAAFPLMWQAAISSPFPSPPKVCAAFPAQISLICSFLGVLTP